MTLGLAKAERFVTIPEAQKLSFPQAVRFEDKTFRLTPDQIREIENRSRTRNLAPNFRAWLAYETNKLAGVIFFDKVIGKHEFIDYVVAISVDGEVRHVEILEYRESYGGQIRGPKWRAQFRGKTAGARLRLGDDIYNISGATLSCRHVTDGVKKLLAIFEVAVRPRLRPGGGLRDPA